MENRPLGDMSLLNKLFRLERAPELPSNFRESIVEAHLFRGPLGSHNALHTFQTLCKDDPHTIVAEAISGAFKDPALRESIETNWVLSCDFDRASSQEEILDESAPHDLASWTISNCLECFKFLVEHGAVRTSSFCRTGESFFLLAMKSEKREAMDIVVSTIDYKEVFQPFWMSEPAGDRKTILQASTYNEPVFRACWSRVRSHPYAPQYTLGPQEIGHICRFVDVKLADDLLQHGVDIAKPHPENLHPGWLEIVCQSDASAMLDWFLRRGYAPPGWYLTYAAEHNCVHAIQWILLHTDDYHDWVRASFVSAKHENERSVEMLEAILQSSVSKWKPDRRLAEDLAITIVDSMCDESEFLHKNVQYISPGGAGPTLREMLCLRENIAIRKLETLRDVPGGVSVVGLKIKTSAAGLHGVTKALEKLEP
ncbi:hypothetical protein N7532_001406 [Penicillium argentinense]|uniref:Uncharacterized protein n=1 Tax=Penicillium argentinense TaxID=1131581 RepID=A0A9W9G2N3_9EURO|nr:uncharacterized protein N7532_001406 [Penicillium argentinense]KAJ5110871.1 hypothetical protein N7532_001406 [Penicillium argentinense]